MTIEFKPEPDVAGMGRVVVDGRYYGLPAHAVKDLAAAITELERVNGNAQFYTKALWRAIDRAQKAEQLASAAERRAAENELDNDLKARTLVEQERRIVTLETALGGLMACAKGDLKFASDDDLRALMLAEHTSPDVREVARSYLAARAALKEPKE